MNVPRAAGEVLVPLRHEARHDSEARADLLRAGLEQDRPIGGFERLREQDRRLVHAWPGLGVQAFDRNAELAHLVHQRGEEVTVGVRAQQRVAEHSGRDRRRSDAFLLGPGGGRLGEVEPLELHPAHRYDTERLRALQHALEHLPRADRQRNLLAVLVGDEIAEEERHAAVPGNGAKRPEVDLREHVGEPLVPSGERRVVVGDVHHVPAEHDVAEAESAFRGRVELLLVDVFAAQHAVDVRDRDLHAIARRVADRGDDLGGRGRIRHAVLQELRFELEFLAILAGDFPRARSRATF